MDTKWQPAMMSAISEVLETMFFESLDFDVKGPGARNWYCESTIEFSNEDQAKEISFRFTEPFARLIAANFLGSSENTVSQEEVADVMRELTNMVGGNFLGRLTDENWRLAIPAFRLTQGSGGGAASGMSLMYMGDCVGVVSLEPVAG